jgi:hypothetical protein
VNVRGEINGLIDGWRSSRQQDKEALTRLFDRRIADALAMALEGDAATAQTLLKGALETIAEERKSRGRIEQLFYAGATAAAVALIALIGSWFWGPQVTNYFADNANALLFAATVAGFGALISMGIAIRERSLATDLQTRDNIADAILRVVLGAVGAVLLIAMLRSDLIDIEVGNVDLSAQIQAQEPQQVNASPDSPPALPAPPGEGGGDRAGQEAPAAGAGGVDGNLLAADNVSAPAPGNSQTSPAEALINLGRS